MNHEMRISGLNGRSLVSIWKTGTRIRFFFFFFKHHERYHYILSQKVDVVIRKFTSIG
jgi:hypothetical protein